MAREIAALVLLFVSVAVVLLCCAGLLLGDVYDRLHFVGPASVLAPWLLAAALFIEFSFVESVIKGILLAAAVMLTSPVLTHATAKMVHRLRELGIAETAIGHD